MGQIACAFCVLLTHMLLQDDLKDTQHEKYHGERSYDALMAWSKHIVDQIMHKVPNTVSLALHLGP